MKLNHYLKEDVLFMELSGDLLGENNGLQAVEVANDYIMNRKVKKCAVDLSMVRYMNSNGLGILITLLTKFRNKDGEFVLIHPSEQISKLLMITKLNSIFTITKDNEEAVKMLEAK
ncbi:MAG TPA: STAS domain-containing protein [Cytophagaceae bacterium]|jgi:anti-sigma B factor antagonist|nr:STAS domain-containing protein [Cytophagaceae bacterium]